MEQLYYENVLMHLKVYFYLFFTSVEIGDFNVLTLDFYLFNTLVVRKRKAAQMCTENICFDEKKYDSVRPSFTI